MFYREPLLRYEYSETNNLPDSGRQTNSQKKRHSVVRKRVRKYKIGKKMVENRIGDARETITKYKAINE